MDSTATRRSSRLNQVTRIRSVALNNAMSDSKRRVFSITVSDGKTKFFTAAVPDHASTHTIDDLFNMMRWTVSPLNDLKINTDELAALQRSYLQITGLHETQRPQLSKISESIGAAHDNLRRAASIPLSGMRVNVDLRDEKLHHLRSANRHYGAAAALLSSFVQIDDLREKGIISEARRDADLAVIDRGTTLFKMWKNAFKEGLFI